METMLNVIQVACIAMSMVAISGLVRAVLKGKDTPPPTGLAPLMRMTKSSARRRAA